MAPFYLMLALLVQFSLCHADEAYRNGTESIELVSELDENVSDVKDLDKNKEKISDINEQKKSDSKKLSHGSDVDDTLIDEFRTATNDWVDMFIGSSLNPSTSTSLMAEATNPNKSPEEQLEEIKEVASEITMAIQNEMTTLLSYALNIGDKDGEDNKLRRRRCTETPMDSSKLVMKLLNHIKSNNEYQNIAIEKMMSAQEIADKFGVEFNPDPETLSDLAFATIAQAQELTSILQEAFDVKNSSSIPELANSTEHIQEHIPVTINPSCYVFSSDYPDSENVSSLQSHEHSFQPAWDTNHIHRGDNHAGYNYYNYHVENQIPSPSTQHSHESYVTAKPTFYDSISYNPNDYYSPYCSVDPMAFQPFYSFDDSLALEPELFREECEETVSSKVIIEQDEEPGSATVNHVMTYTVSEKAHFRTPQIEKLPQQMQYYFFLM